MFVEREELFKPELDRLRSELAAKDAQLQEALDGCANAATELEKRHDLIAAKDARIAELEAALNAMWPMTEAEASLKSHALKGTFDDFSCSKEHMTVQPPCRDPQARQTSDVLLLECLSLLHSFALEQTGWRGLFRRWYYSDEPLRHDAANLVRRAEYMEKRPEFTRLVGEGR